MITEPTGLSSLPWVDFRMGCDEITDSVLVRIEHHWAAPDQDPLAFYIDEVSETHFWTVDGTWEDGIEGSENLLLDARLNYVGSDETGLDFDLYNDTEANAFLAWRPDSDSEWKQYPDYTWQPGSLVNGNGMFKVTNLRKGQYAFANGDVFLNIHEQINGNEGGEEALLIYPSPATSYVDLSWDESQSVDGVSVYDSAGRCVKRESVSSAGSLRLSVTDLSTGNYIAVLSRGREPLASNSLVIE